MCHEGKYFAIATGYDWAKGVEGIGSNKANISVY